MRGANIFHHDLLRLDRLGEFDAADRILVQPTFHALARFWIAGAAVVGLEFEAVKNRRIMARCDHHATNGVLCLDGERH